MRLLRSEELIFWSYYDTRVGPRACVFVLRCPHTSTSMVNISVPKDRLVVENEAKNPVQPHKTEFNSMTI